MIKLHNNNSIIYLNAKYKDLLELLKNQNNFMDNLIHSEFSGRERNYLLKFKDINIIVRHCKRGGLAAGLGYRYFLYNRFLNEFNIHYYLWKNNFNITEPAAVIILKLKYFYEAYYLTVQLSNSVTLNEYLNNNSDSEILYNVLNQVKKLIFDFKVYHKDLQVKNILVRNNEIYIIDFDKSKFIYKFYKLYFLFNILRFIRSLTKNKLLKNNKIVSDLLNKFGYSKNKFFGIIKFFYEIKWKLGDIFKI